MDLNFEGLVVLLGGRCVLRGIDVHFQQGRVTTILGPNGAGKSSLVKAAAALLPAHEGAVRLGDKDLARMRPRERAQLVGYLPQQADLHWNMLAREVVALGRMAHRAPFAAPDETDRIAIDDAIAATEITPLLDRSVADLSGGERARVLLARVLAGEPAWLLADEPLASLDPAHQIDILERLRKRAAAGAGVVIVLHDLVQAARAADDVVLLKNGQIAAFGPVEQTLTAETLGHLFDVEVVMAEGPCGRRLPIAMGRPSGAKLTGFQSCENE